MGKHSVKTLQQEPLLTELTGKPDAGAKPAIDEATVIALYRSGLSQKDIVSRFNISISHTHRILKEAGFDTARLRRLSSEVKRISVLLACRGVPYRTIERKADIHYDAVRDYVYHGGLKIGGLLEEVSPGDIPKPPRFAAFRRRYMEGACFCPLVSEFRYSEEETLAALLALDEAAVEKHAAALSVLIRRDSQNGISHSGIANKHSLSCAVVRRILEDEGAEKERGPA